MLYLGFITNYTFKMARSDRHYSFCDKVFLCCQFPHIPWDLFWEYLHVRYDTSSTLFHFLLLFFSLNKYIVQYPRVTYVMKQKSWSDMSDRKLLEKEIKQETSKKWHLKRSLNEISK